MAAAMLIEESAIFDVRSPHARRCRTGPVRAGMGPLLAMAIVVGWSLRAGAQEGFLQRDGGVTSAYPYGYGDGGQESPEEQAGRWELPGPFALPAPDPLVQALVVGPSFRNQERSGPATSARNEVGGGVGYVNSKWAVPFEFSAEGTWVRLKRQPPDNRN